MAKKTGRKSKSARKKSTGSGRVHVKAHTVRGHKVKAHTRSRPSRRKRSKA